MTALAVGGAMHVSIAGGDETPDWAYTGEGDAFEVGRCRLTVSTPMLKAPTVSALEARI